MAVYAQYSPVRQFPFLIRKGSSTDITGQAFQTTFLAVRSNAIKLLKSPDNGVSTGQAILQSPSACLACPVRGFLDDWNSASITARPDFFTAVAHLQLQVYWPVLVMVGSGFPGNDFSTQLAVRLVHRIPWSGFTQNDSIWYKKTAPLVWSSLGGIPVDSL
jgi:hypothetical protein